MRPLPALAALIALAVLAAPAAAGAAPRRFLDEVFPDVAMRRAIPYGAHPEQLLDLYRPRGDRRRRRPAMVWVHGGGLAGGGRAHRTLRSLARGSARRGYVALSVDYRILAPPGCDTMEQPCRDAAIADQHDVQAAIRWLRGRADRLGVDPRRIAVGGTSMGGVLSYLVGTRGEDPGDAGTPGEDSSVAAFVSIAGGFPHGGGYATPGDAPGLFFHGTRDRVVPLSWSTTAFAALRRVGVPARLVRIPRGQHVAYEVYGDRYDRGVARFLYRRLGLAPPP